MEFLRKLAKLLAMVVFLTSFWTLLIFFLFEPQEVVQTLDKAKELYYRDNKRDFSELLKINGDIQGWINIPNTQIDYPVLYKKNNNDYYLSHNYKREATNYGSIFIDSHCKNIEKSKNIILHGHHMRNGMMFAGIMKFGDLDFYKSTPVLTFNTLENSAEWKIFAIFKTNTTIDQGKIFGYIIPDFESDKEFLEFVHQIKIRSMLDIPVDINKDDQILTLSTCSYEFEGFRTVIIARKIRNNEGKNVDVNLAKKAANPLMPGIWYKKYGGNTPIF